MKPLEANKSGASCGCKKKPRAFGEGIYTLLAADSLNGTLGSETNGIVGGYLASLTIDDNAIVLSTVVIPEPRLAAALFAAIALALAGLRRHRRLTGNH